MLSIIGILLCLGVLSYFNIRRQTTRELIKWYENKATEEILSVERSLDDVERELHYLARNPVVQKLLENKYENYLKAQNDVSNHVEPRFWYLVTSSNSGIEDLQLISYGDVLQVGDFIYGKDKLKEHSWHEKLLSEKERIVYEENGEVFLVYPIYRVQFLRMMGAIWVRLDLDYLWKERRESPGVLGYQVYLGDRVLVERGQMSSGVRVEEKSDKSDIRICYCIAPPSLFEGGFVMLILVLTSGLAILILFQYYSQKLNEGYERIMEEKRKQEYLQAMVLKAQINPHFLYNIMSMINWKAKYSGQEDISRICRQLSDFYRTALNKGQEEICIRDEILNIESYLKLKQNLVEIPFSYDIEVQEDCQELTILNFILQPIVENAIIHGIGNLEEGGNIHISVRKEGGDLLLIVKDNGKFFVSQEVFFANKNGYGIRSVHERIRFKYGEKYGVFLKNDSEGTEVTLKVREYNQKYC